MKYEKTKFNESWISSELQEWQTPKPLFNALNKKFNFNIDVAATDENHLCDHYFTAQTNGLDQDWKLPDGTLGRCFMNPPYRDLPEWFDKVIQELSNGNAELIVTLTPSRSTETNYFQNVVLKYAFEIWFLSPRVQYKFPKPEPKKKKRGTPFASMVCIFSNGSYQLKGIHHEKGIPVQPIVKGVKWKEFVKENINKNISDYFSEVKT